MPCLKCGEQVARIGREAPCVTWPRMSILSGQSRTRAMMTTPT